MIQIKYVRLRIDQESVIYLLSSRRSSLGTNCCYNSVGKTMTSDTEIARESLRSIQTDFWQVNKAKNHHCFSGDMKGRRKKNRYALLQ